MVTLHHYFLIYHTWAVVWERNDKSEKFYSPITPFVESFNVHVHEFIMSEYIMCFYHKAEYDMY